MYLDPIYNSLHLLVSKSQSLSLPLPPCKKPYTLLVHSSRVSLYSCSCSVTKLCTNLLSPPGSSDHGISQARILEWVAVPFSRGSSQPKDRTQVFCIARRFFTVWATREAPRNDYKFSLFQNNPAFLSSPPSSSSLHVSSTHVLGNV